MANILLWCFISFGIGTLSGIFVMGMLNNSKGEKTFRLWVAKDKCGEVWGYQGKPYKDGGMWLSKRYIIPLEIEKLPDDMELSWEDEEPKELEVVVREVNDNN